MNVASASSHDVMVIPLTKERISSIRIGSIIIPVMSLFPLLLFLSLHRFRIPFPVSIVNYSGVLALILIILCFILFIIGLWTSWYLLQFTKTTLRLSSTSVEYHTPHFALRTSWKNIERIGVSSTGVEAFLLRQEATFNAMTKRTRTRPVLDSIPLAGFGKTYGQDTLARVIRQWAPHLMQPDT